MDGSRSRSVTANHHARLDEGTPELADNNLGLQAALGAIGGRPKGAYLGRPTFLRIHFMERTRQSCLTTS